MDRIVMTLAFAACMTAAFAGRAADGAIAPSANAALSLDEAYAKGAVEVSVYVVPGYGDGRKLRVALKNRGDARLRVRIPAGAIALDVGDPIPAL